ncbi:MAG: hypothetical protein KVP17_002349 [Porospora cf. gigantea B]|uniref:uncharacterized protein n=1 Tax=Porospora cf. gigantea B TaxID=2853592 RepID=UPI003571E1A7|nr:MAG: hypothetical protein KVP17_002349 [Porospora cf. gigantea B]
MGISGFFRFVSERYPLILTDLGEGEGPTFTDNVSIKEFDNLYIDLNGLIHPLTHNGLGFTYYDSQTEAMLAVVHYITQLVYLTKPRKLLYLAVDGVAPRAKLNQQRSRRYKSATRLRGIPPSKFKFDSNCITPGTEFMLRLQQYLQFSIAILMETDPIWRRLQVIYSGPNTCGEGEHKIAAFIRQLKTLPAANRNLRHCIHGLDADLLMLGLACHEHDFFLLRERIDFTNDKANGVLRSRLLTCEAKFQLLDLSILRQYLCISFTKINSHSDVSSFRFRFDGERVVDDFIILSLLCGNDFLPELEVATIKKGNMGRIHSLYHQYLVDFVPTAGSTEPWLMKNCGQVDWHSLRLFFRIVADVELNLSDAKTDVSRRWLRWRYYYLKLGINLFTPAGRAEIQEFFIEYLHGIQWVCIYYFRGCPSWSWFFPYHYGPFIVDMLELLPQMSGEYLLPEMNEPDLIKHDEMPSELDTRLEFRSREPRDVVYTTDCWQFPEAFLSPDGSRPLEMQEQLMSVLPIDSKSLVPCTYWSLMEEDSPISEFYPDPYVVPVDLPPDTPDWKGKYLLPFIDERRLKDAMEAARLVHPLSERDVLTNAVGTSFVFRTPASDNSPLPDSPPPTEYQPVVVEMPHGVEAPWLTALEALPSQCPHVSRAPYGLSLEPATFPTVPLKVSSESMVTRKVRMGTAPYQLQSAQLATGVLKHSYPSTLQSVYLVYDPPLTWNSDYFKNFLNELLSFQRGTTRRGIHEAKSPVVEIDFPNRTMAQVLSVSTRDK